MQIRIWRRSLVIQELRSGVSSFYYSSEDNRITTESANNLFPVLLFATRDIVHFLQPKETSRQEGAGRVL